MSNPDLIEALTTDNLTAIKAIPKTDVHCHAFFSTRRQNVEKLLDHTLARPPPKMNGIEGMMEYADGVLTPHIRHKEGFEFIALSAVNDAIQDGVVILEMSFDIRIAGFYPDGLIGMHAYIGGLVERFRSQINLRPELGYSRLFAEDPNQQQLAFEAIDLGIFQSIDLYSRQEYCLPEVMKPLYLRAKAAGMKLKAHVGEFEDAEEIRRTVEILDLDEVQHGIAAVESVEVMRWLSDNQIQLNVCPTSNVMLGGVQELASHPIRVLYDNGVNVTINTDDLMIFDQSVSEEYLNLYRADVFSAQELDEIRRASLNDKVM